MMTLMVALVSVRRSTVPCAALSAASSAGNHEHRLIVDACLEGAAASKLLPPARERVASYVNFLLTYNERTNVYSKSAYDKLPFHVQDSITLAFEIGRDLTNGRENRKSDVRAEGGGVLDMGSGSGLPSVILACVYPDVPVYAIESKSRKTRFLEYVGREIG